MGEVAKTNAGAVSPIAEASALVSMIERAARDPAIDLDKLDRLLAMHDHMRAQQAEQAFNNAMAAAQGEMEPVKRDCDNPQTRSKYASFAALDRAIRPIYSRHGFGVSFNTQAPRSKEPLEIGVIAYVTGHGHTRVYEIDMPTDGKGARGGDVMTRTHATGSGVSYGRRYLMQMIFNLATENDDDGNAAAGRPQPQQRAPDRQQAKQPAEPSKPHKLTPLVGDTYRAWVDRFVAFIDACDTRAHLGDWRHLNEEFLDKVKVGAPNIYRDDVEAAFARCEARVAKAPQQEQARQASTEPAGASSAAGATGTSQTAQANVGAPTAADDAFPEPWVRQQPGAYVAYAIRWLEAAPCAAVPDIPAIDARWDTERKIRNGLADRIDPKDIEWLVEVKGAAKARAKAAPYKPPTESAAATNGAPKLDVDKFMKEVRALYAKAATGEELEIAHETHVAPRLDDLLPPEAEDVMGEYRKRERELAP